MSIGAHLAAARKQRGLTQEQVAKLAGITRRSVCNYEADARIPRADALHQLAVTLQVSMTWLVTGHSTDVALPLPPGLMAEQIAALTALANHFHQVNQGDHA